MPIQACNRTKTTNEVGGVIRINRVLRDTEREDNMLCMCLESFCVNCEDCTNLSDAWESVCELFLDRISAPMNRRREGRSPVACHRLFSLHNM